MNATARKVVAAIALALAVLAFALPNLVLVGVAASLLALLHLI